MKVNKHVLYTADDFKHMTGQEQEDSQLVSMVIDGGLSVCKKCHESEAGLDKPCKIIDRERYL
jgi:hypothetical protein